MRVSAWRPPPWTCSWRTGTRKRPSRRSRDRAGLNRATFFRHFADKREVLFGGEAVLAGLFADGIRAASPGATLTECLQAAFAAAGVAMTPQQRAKAAQRVLVVAANSEVQERGLLKHARIARSISAALRERGADELTARLGAEVGMLAFTIAVERWMEVGQWRTVPAPCRSGHE